MQRKLAWMTMWLLPGMVFASDAPLLQRQSSWSWPGNEKISTQVVAYLDSKLSSSDLEHSKQLVASASHAGVGVLDTVLQVTSKVEPVVDALKRVIESPASPELLSQMESHLSTIMSNGSVPSWLKSDMQLICARYQVHHSLFDEALQRLNQISPESVSDPATLFFCVAICRHHLLERAACLEALDKLLERENELPSRYAVTARLMQADIMTLKEDTLDEVARLMNDVERRLTLGRAGKLVQDKEQAIVDKLEKMIDKLEQQQQEQQQKQQKGNSGGSPNQKPQQGTPQDDSQIAGTKGPGNVDPKDIGDGSGWGNLPPAQRQEALQNMTKDLPSHYREVIEAYFKRLASSQQP
jgi:hypothetical protein